MEVFERLESDVRSYCRSFPVVFQRAKGSHLYDIEGRRYLDFFSSAGSLNYGHNDAAIKGAVIGHLEQDGLVTALDMYTVTKRDFLETFESTILSPRGLEYKVQFTSPTGTSVVESAIKLARKVTGRSNVVAFTNAFHGMTAASLSLTGNRAHRQQSSSGHVTRMPYHGFVDQNFDSIGYFRKLLLDASSGIDLPAAVILETVQAEGGINIASREWLRDLRLLTQAFDILLIVDDIQVGCGRTGSFFSFEDAGVVPDLVCLSKSLSGLGLPFSILLLRHQLDSWKPGEDSGTFRGNNLAFVGAATALRQYWRGDALQAHVGRMHDVVNEWATDLRARFPLVIRATRGRGLIYGLEMIRPADAGIVTRRCFENGLIVETCGAESQVVKLLPALNIQEDVLRAGLSIIEEAVEHLSRVKGAGVSPRVAASA
jgi:diaminobutyrate-2-oxoglutarate transaminase